MAVLWATHLVDEIRPEDPVIVLHRGKVLVNASAADIAGGSTLSAAFLTMTGGEDTE
jgi:ABC-2 type transport system ATP-binding protein